MPMICELCDGQEFVKRDGLFVCQKCGTKYTLEEAKNLMKNQSAEKDDADDSSKCYFCNSHKDSLLYVSYNDGEDRLNTYVCPSCMKKIAQYGQVRVLTSNNSDYPAGYTEGNAPEPDIVDDSKHEEYKDSDLDVVPSEIDAKPSGDDLKKTYTKSGSNKIGCAILGVIIAVVIIVPICIVLVKDSKTTTNTTKPYSSYSSSSSSRTSGSSSDSVYIPDSLSDSLMSKMWKSAQDEVKKNLKSPSTAKFEKYYSDDVQFIKGKKEDVETGGFNVSILSYVDSQNSFGAEIRTYFIVYFMVDRYDSYKIVDSLFYEP